MTDHTGLVTMAILGGGVFAIALLKLIDRANDLLAGR